MGPEAHWLSASQSIFGVIITFFDCDIKHVIMMQFAEGSRALGALKLNM